MLQQIALGGAMITLPIYLQMVLEYNALQAGLSLAPLSLSMFGTAILAGKASRQAAAGQHHPGRVRLLLLIGMLAVDPDRPARRRRLVPRTPAGDRRDRARAARLAAQQLHTGADRRGAGQRSRRRELGRGIVRAVVRPGVRRRDHAGDARVRLHQPGGTQRRALPGRAAARRRRAGERRRRS